MTLFAMVSWIIEDLSMRAYFLLCIQHNSNPRSGSWHLIHPHKPFYQNGSLCPRLVSKNDPLCFPYVAAFSSPDIKTVLCKK